MNADEVLEVINRFHTASTERGEAPSSQAAELLRSGWHAVGYLLAAPTTKAHPETGEQALYGVKRVAVRPEDALDMEEWYQRNYAAGYTALCRFYLKQGKLKMANSAFKSPVVHRGNMYVWEVITGFYPQAARPSGHAEEWADFAKTVTLKLFNAKDAAHQIALTADMVNRGAKLAYFNSTAN
jgi:hypothetical protein